MRKEIQKESNNHYIYRKGNKRITKVMPGEFYITDKEEVLVTVLGSCIAACIYDFKNGIGGMNHFMLPHSFDGVWAGNSLALRYGNYAMEHLINELVKKGALRRNLKAKIFGGANINTDLKGDIGHENIKFVKEYLASECIPIELQDLGGKSSRKIHFQSQNGDSYVKYINGISHIIAMEEKYQKEIDEKNIEYDIELF